MAGNDQVQMAPIMGLKDFISSVLSEIMTGVKDAQEPAADRGGCINPLHLHSGDLRQIPLFERETKNVLRLVEFDVAITAAEGEHRGGKAEVKVYGFLGGGGELGSEKSRSTASRIKFSVPVLLPGQEPGEQR